MLVTIKAYQKQTKNGKTVILPLLEDVRNNRTFFINRGFAVTMEIPDEEIQRLVDSGVLWDSSKRNPNTTNTAANTKAEPTDVGGF
jgi:hypothetical protein